jgi:hypothetical protein
MSIPDEFYNQLPQRTDEQLYDMLAQSADYLPEALEAARRELRKRRLPPERATQIRTAVPTEGTAAPSLDQDFRRLAGEEPETAGQEEPRVVWTQNWMTMFFGGIGLLLVWSIAGIHGWFEGNSGNLLGGLTLVFGASCLLTGVFRIAQRRQIELSGKTLRMRVWSKETARVSIRALSRKQWHFRPLGEHWYDVIFYIIGREGGLGLHAVTPGGKETAIFLSGFPTRRILEQLADRGVECPLTSMVQMTGSDRGAFLIFTQIGVIGTDPVSDVVLHDATVMPKHATWEILKEKDQVKLTNVGDGVLAVDKRHLKRGEDATASTSTDVMLGDRVYHFQGLG